jgi:hypothetical protein
MENSVVRGRGSTGGQRRLDWSVVTGLKVGAKDVLVLLKGGVPLMELLSRCLIIKSRRRHHLRVTSVKSRLPL